MKKNILYKTNFIVCIIIIMGFIITSIISYRSNQSAFEQDVERVSELSSQNIYHQIDKVFSKPIHVSTTMANDSLLKEFLNAEGERKDEAGFLQSMQKYLMAYKEKYGYDSVALISRQTNRYYHFSGVNRTLELNSDEDDWYYNFLNSDEEYIFNIDNDESKDNEITVFLNCKIKNSKEDIIGLVSIGFREDIILSLLKEHESALGIRAFLTDPNGNIKIATDITGADTENLFDKGGFEDLRSLFETVDSGSNQTLWHPAGASREYVVIQYIPNLEWYLVIAKDISDIHAHLSRQLIHNILVVSVVIIGVLLIITRIIHKYNEQIIKLTIAREQEHRTVFIEATEQLYENINEIDLTHNRAASETTEAYFESLGIAADTPYDQALRMITEKQVKKEFQKDYFNTFSLDNALISFQNGLDTLRFDFLFSSTEKNYCWMRATARIFYWEEDRSLRMFVYRQNIDLEKQQEQLLLEKMQRDSLSDLYNKAATQEKIHQLLTENPDKSFAFFIMDIDNFKQVNDTYGHVTGDQVIKSFAQTLKKQFREGDIVGRIGGDEFVAFVLSPSPGWIKQRAKDLVEALSFTFENETVTCKISSSIGAAVSPMSGSDFETLYKNSDSALYETKRTGKHGFTIYKA